MIDKLTQYLNKKAKLLEESLRIAGYDSIYIDADRDLVDELGYFSSKELGIEAVIGLDGLIDTVFIHSDKHHDFHEFSGPLPAGLNFKMRRKAVRQLLGAPKDTGGPVSSPLNAAKIYWDRWQINDYTIHCEYPRNLKQIQMVTITRKKTNEVTSGD